MSDEENCFVANLPHLSTVRIRCQLTVESQLQALTGMNRREHFDSVIRVIQIAIHIQILRGHFVSKIGRKYFACPLAGRSE
jgi:hypothetical protein